MKMLQNYGLSIALFLLFAFSWVGQGAFQWREFVAEQEEHNQPVQVSQYFDAFMKSTLENWQSEFLQLFSFVVLATYLIHKGSPQSRDSEDEMLARIKDIQKKLDKKSRKS